MDVTIATYDDKKTGKIKPVVNSVETKMINPQRLMFHWIVAFPRKNQQQKSKNIKYKI